MNKLLTAAILVAISTSPTILKNIRLGIPGHQNTSPAPSEYREIQPDDAPYAQNCDLRGRINDQDVWECYPDGRGKNEDGFRIMGIALSQLPHDVLEWSVTPAKPKKKH